MKLQVVQNRGRDASHPSYEGLEVFTYSNKEGVDILLIQDFNKQLAPRNGEESKVLYTSSQTYNKVVLALSANIPILVSLPGGFVDGTETMYRAKKLTSTGDLYLGEPIGTGEENVIKQFQYEFEKSKFKPSSLSRILPKYRKS